MVEILQFALGIAILGFTAYVAHVWTKDRIEGDLTEQVANLRRITMTDRARLERLAIENRNLRARLTHANVTEPELPEWLND